MKLFTKRCLLFLLVILLLIPIYLYVWGEYSPQLLNSISNIRYYDVDGDFMRLRIQEAKDLKDVEILVLGSSHAYRGFDPRIFNQHGMKVFNFGSSSQSPIQTEVLLKKYYETMNPQVVIFEIYPGIFSIDGTEGAIGLLSSDQIDLHSVIMALEINNSLIYKSLLFSFMKNNVMGNLSSEHPQIFESHRYIPGGYVERDKIYHYENETFSNSEWNLLESQWQAFERCLNIISKNGAEIFLVYAPITKDYYESKTNNDQFISRMAEYGYPIYNFNTILTLDDETHFYDSHHLNQTGVKVFNNSLFTELNLNAIKNL